MQYQSELQIEKTDMFFYYLEILNNMQARGVQKS